MQCAKYRSSSKVKVTLSGQTSKMTIIDLVRAVSHSCIDQPFLYLASMFTLMRQRFMTDPEVHISKVKVTVEGQIEACPDHNFVVH